VSAPDTAVATRHLRAAAGLLHAAEATGRLDLGALSSLLGGLGLSTSVSDAHALCAPLLTPNSPAPTALEHLPWPGLTHVQGATVLAHGPAALLDTALRLAAAHTLGRAPAQLAFSGSPLPSAEEPMLQLVASFQDGNAPVLLVVGPAALTVDLLSPAPRDLGPVLQVLAGRLGLPAPANQDAAADLLPLLFRQDGALRDERVRNDARAGVFSTAAGALVDVSALDADAVDARVEAAVRASDAAVVCCEPALLPLVLERLGPRVKAALLVAPAQLTGAGTVELPDRLHDALSGHVLGGLLGDSPVQGKDLPAQEGVVVGEAAVGAPSLLLAGAARRATLEGKAPVMDAASAQAAFDLWQARGGVLAASARVGVAVYRSDRASSGRAVVAAFLAAQLAGRTRSGVASAAASAAGAAASRKIRIRG
jgi:hypothetical protein